MSLREEIKAVWRRMELAAKKDKGVRLSAREVDLLVNLQFGSEIDVSSS